MNSTTTLVLVICVIGLVAIGATYFALDGALFKQQQNVTAPPNVTIIITVTDAATDQPLSGDFIAQTDPGTTILQTGHFTPSYNAITVPENTTFVVRWMAEGHYVQSSYITADKNKTTHTALKPHANPVLSAEPDTIAPACTQNITLTIPVRQGTWVRKATICASYTLGITRLTTPLPSVADPTNSKKYDKCFEAGTLDATTNITFTVQTEELRSGDHVVFALIDKDLTDLGTSWDEKAIGPDDTDLGIPITAITVGARWNN